MIFGKKQTESFLGIDIGSGGMKLVELKKTKGRPQLWTYGVADKELDIHVEAHTVPDIDDIIEKGNVSVKENIKRSIYEFASDERIAEYGDLLKELLEQAKVSSRIATASLPVSYVFHALVTLPPVGKKEVAHHIKAKIKKMLPQDIEEMQIVFQEVPDEINKTKYYKYLVTAAPKKLVAFYTAIFNHAGIQLKELETEAFALTRSLVGNDKTVSMIVDIGAQRTNFFIVDAGLPMTQRSLQIGGNDIDAILAKSLGVDSHITSQIKRDLSFDNTQKLNGELFQKIVRPMIKEIEYNFGLFFKQSGNEQKKPEKIILTGGSSVFPIFQQYLSEQFQVRVFVGDPWARIVCQQGLKKTLDSFGTRMAVSIGLAMRNIV
jgi:type IV pilus assembly protein PilM